jgi:hypothetical protein
MPVTSEGKKADFEANGPWPRAWRVPCAGSLAGRKTEVYRFNPNSNVGQVGLRDSIETEKRPAERPPTFRSRTDL